LFFDAFAGVFNLIYDIAISLPTLPPVPPAAVVAYAAV
jgi:hypothetical protein